MDNNMIIEASPPLHHFTELVQTVEQATHMAKQLPRISDIDHHRLIFSALNSAQFSLSSFISARNSHNSAVAGGGGGDEPMIIADNGGEEEVRSSKDSSMEKMGEMREFLYIQNKRPKRLLSPSAAAAVEQQGFEERDRRMLGSGS